MTSFAYLLRPAIFKYIKEISAPKYANPACIVSVPANGLISPLKFILFLTFLKKSNMCFFQAVSVSWLCVHRRQDPYEEETQTGAEEISYA